MRRALLAIVAVAGCGGGAAEVETFQFTMPGAALEIVPVPGEPVAIAWIAAGDPGVAVDLVLRPRTPPGPDLALGTRALADGGLAWSVPDPAPRAGLYQLRATLRDGATVLDEVAAPTVVLLQGAEFRDAALTFTGAGTERDLWITVTTASIVEVEVFLAGPAGLRRVLARATVASDLAPIGRVYPFTGQTVDGAAIPAGTHDAFLEVRPPAHAAYLRGGLTVTWTP